MDPAPKRKVGVIIIGFKYTDRQIQCALYDIYRMYEQYITLGYECYVLTDLADFRFNKNIYNTILRNQVDQKLIDFIDEIKRTPTWYKYTYDFQTLKSNISELPVFDLCITYYSGHGRTRGIELPAGDILNYVGFRTMVSLKAKTELILIMDCCHVSNMNLPYCYDSVYIDDKFKSFFKAVENVKCKDSDYTNPTVLLLASNDTDEEAAANKYTSLFTKYLLEFVKLNEQRSFRSLIEFIQTHIAGHDTNSQSVKIYSSIGKLPVIPSYLFGKYYITVNNALACLTFERL